MSRFTAFNFKDWINEHRELLKTPVGNKMVWADREFIVMVVGGPNERTDYHVNRGEEFFYQLEGSMALKVIDDNGDFIDIALNEGDIYLLPPNVPHSPQRGANSVGLVVERKRRDGEDDGLQWYCSNCKKLIYKETFPLRDIENDFGAVFERYYGNPESHTCKSCGTVNGK